MVSNVVRRSFRGMPARYLARRAEVKPSEAPFLTARWKSLVLLNYACPPGLLEPLVPQGTGLDQWGGTTYVSLVGFMFVDTRVRNVAVPLHRTFEEVNLRFYVRREQPDGEVRRGVVFMRELVPRFGIAAVARLLYNEPYTSVPMSHSVRLSREAGGQVSYTWRYRGSAYAVAADASGPARTLERGSEAEFITEHYWGYSRQRDGSTLEYRVAHPPWQVWSAEGGFRGDGSRLYGPQLGRILGAEPLSAYVAMGSEVTVFPGHRLDDA